jgi:hypothetical protein
VNAGKLRTDIEQALSRLPQVEGTGGDGCTSPPVPSTCGKRLRACSMSVRSFPAFTPAEVALADAQSLALGHDNQFIEPLHLMSALLNQEGGSVHSRPPRLIKDVPIPLPDSARRSLNEEVR